MTNRFLWILVAIVAAKLFVHATFLPAWEGPDEPFHLGRILPPEKEPARGGDLFLQSRIAASVAEHPCAADLRRVFGCPSFSGTGAFNVLDRSSPGVWTGEAIANYESHQPPAFYLLGAGVLRIGGLDEDPVTALLAVRLLCVSFVIFGLVAVRQIDAASFLLLSFVLLLPGAAESLARAANDALLFLACAALIYAATKKRTAMLFVAAAAAPLIKLTAFPFVAAVAAREWFEGRKLRGVAIAAASLLVVPIQAARGWAWGGTVELNQSRFAIDEPLMDSLIGMLRSIYTITKTTIWLGNWSFFKAPVALLAIIALLGIVTLLFTRVRGTASGRYSFICGLGVLGAGVVAFAVAHRSLFGEWGGVGGWYIWGVMPWIIVGLTDNLRITDRARMPVAACCAAALIVTNALWFRSASTLYGLL